MSVAETHEEFVHDAILAVVFGLLALVAGYRAYLYFTLTGSGKVVTLFYSLIFTTSFVRCVWFGIPSSYLEGNYLPKATSEWLVERLTVLVGNREYSTDYNVTEFVSCVVVVDCGTI